VIVVLQYTKEHLCNKRLQRKLAFKEIINKFPVSVHNFVAVLFYYLVN